MENTPTTALPTTTPDNLFDRYWVVSAGTELDLGPTHCSTIFVLADKLTHSLEDAMYHAHTVADELRTEIIEDNLWAMEDLIDWEAYDPDDLDSDTRYEAMYEFGLEHSDAWAEALDSWEDLIRVAAYGDAWDVWVVDADYQFVTVMRSMVSDVVHGKMESMVAAALAEVFEDETPNCGDTTNSRSEEEGL